MTWVLLRGLTREARHWGGFAEQLAQQTCEEVIAVDLPGNGEFASLPSPTSVSGVVDLLRSQLQVRQQAQPFKLLAMSLGGMVATDWAQRYPHEVARLVLINTSLRPFSSATQRLRPHNWPALALLAARWRDAALVEQAVHRLTCNNTGTRDADIAAWLRIRQSAPVTATNAARQLWAAASYACAAKAPACPTLVMSSACDHLVDPACSARLADAWKAGHVQHPWAGHDLPHDDSAWLFGQLKDWLA
ncbi:MAG: alpha/beta hydrolase [Polaromonas sp.]|uniref:alpha/beta fold hydrolase n=1 Tax=Polaromonas sp. TaxID=1869339 RepID=UPI002735E141|nr:alpha/beta hydrolase [Polaromonas sp.]MDP3795883.1 alpha/beta hydrolase [Polaromonas sp.]